MIYILNFDRLALAYIEGARIVTMSGDGTQAMVTSETPLTTEFLSEHNELEKEAIMALSFWRQPCKDCEI
mgnify:CR=1 FL=1